MSEAALSLLSAKAVRARAQAMLRLGETNQLQHWRLDLDRLAATADYVETTIVSAYPDGRIPFHARWRHFAAGGRDRFAELTASAAFADTASQARACFDLAILSVLLDAGAGPDWTYRDRHGQLLSRSEGLAVASLDMFASGAFSEHRSEPLRADASRLVQLDEPTLARHFQAGPANPLVGLAGRVALLNRLGQTLLAAPSMFGQADRPRPGGLFDRIVASSEGGSVAAPDVLRHVLLAFGPIWPSRFSLDGVPLGDCWRYEGFAGATATDAFVPFHKLSQWLAYSLIEPLQWAGLDVRDIDGLTGLPEYRNGGLFVDCGVIALKDPRLAEKPQRPDSALIVEWRALTVALLDRLAALLRVRLALDSQQLPLAKVLEGGTWAAGRRIAAEKRPGGPPPLRIESDGTVF
jgi:hypothetical protein